MARELFIYYRVDSDHATALRPAVIAWQAQLCDRYPGLVARLLVRDDALAQPRTWMETYSTDPRRSPQGVDSACQATIEREALVFAAQIDGPRHSEAFVACAC